MACSRLFFVCDFSGMSIENGVLKCAEVDLVIDYRSRPGGTGSFRSEKAAILFAVLTGPRRRNRLPIWEVIEKARW
jgi:hypothetical protein